jgi:hypothetical protein
MAKKVKSAKEIREEAIETARIVDDAMRSIASSLQEAFGEAGKEVEDLGKEFVKEANRGLKGLKDNAEALYTAQEKSRKGLYSSRDIQKEIEKKGKAIFLIETKIADAIANGATNGAELNKELAKAKGESAKFLASLEESANKSKEINKAMGLTGVGIKGMEKIAGKLGLSGLETVFEDASNASAKMAEGLVDAAKASDTTVGLGGKMQTAFEGVKVAAQGIGAALMDPLFLIGLIVKSVKFLVGIFDHVNKVTNKIGQAVGIAGAEAKNLKAQIHAIGDLSGDMYYNTEEMSNSYFAMNKAVGQNLAMNKENVKTYAQMTMYLGYSESSAAELFKMSVRTGQSYQTISNDVKDEVNALNEAHGVRLDQNQVMDQIVNASNSIKFNQKGSTKGLIDAAHAAARLGMSMDDIAAAAETHLDFESSIAKEIEAEMFLQKDLNLDKLRYAALTGDTAMAAREEERLIKENYKSLKGNVMAQQAFAAATGISMENLSGAMLKQEELQGLTGKELKDKIAADKKTEEMAQKAVSFDRTMQDLVLQIKGILEPLANIVGPVLLGIAKSLGPMLKYVANFAKSGPGKLLLGLAGVAVGFKVASGVLGKIKSFFGFGSNKPTGTPMDPIYTVGGSGSGDMASNILGKLGKRGIFGGKIFKNISKVFGGKNTFMGRQMRNLSSMFLKRSSMTNQLVKNSNFLSKIFPKMSTLNSKLPQAMAQQIGKTLQVDKLGNVTKMANPLKTASTASKAPGFFSKAKNLIPKSATSALSKAGTVATKALKVLGPVGVAADLVLGGASGYSQSQMSAEEQKAAGVEEGISATKATTLGVLTGGAEKGSMFSESLGIEKGSAGDEAMGIAGAAGRGALTGAAIGSFIPVIGTAIGGVVGGAIGGISETFKVFSDPNSSLRKWTSDLASDVGEFATNSMETLGGWASSAGETLSGWASSAGETLSGWGSSAIESVTSFATDSFNSVKSLASGAKDVATSAYNYVKDSSIGKGIASVGSAISDAASYLNPFSYFANGGIAGGGFRAFANGGTVSKPTVGMVGEGRYNEAIIPLPDGKSVPVQMNGGGSGGNSEITSLLKELISEVKKGGNVYLDGSKVGYALALQSSKMG